MDCEVGIELGLTTFADLSDGKTITSPKFFRRAERKLRKAQQELSRKQRGSNTPGGRSSGSVLAATPCDGHPVMPR